MLEASIHHHHWHLSNGGKTECTLPFIIFILSTFSGNHKQSVRQNGCFSFWKSLGHLWHKSHFWRIFFNLIFDMLCLSSVSLILFLVLDPPVILAFVAIAVNITGVGVVCSLDGTRL